MFTGGAELALRVTESHVDRIFEIIVDCQNGSVQAQFMITLEAMAKVMSANKVCCLAHLTCFVRNPEFIYAYISMHVFI